MSASGMVETPRLEAKLIFTTGSKTLSCLLPPRGEGWDEGDYGLRGPPPPGPSPLAAASPQGEGDFGSTSVDLIETPRLPGAGSLGRSNSNIIYVLTTQSPPMHFVAFGFVSR